MHNSQVLKTTRRLNLRGSAHSLLLCSQDSLIQSQGCRVWITAVSHLQSPNMYGEFGGIKQGDVLSTTFKNWLCDKSQCQGNLAIRKKRQPRKSLETGGITGKKRTEQEWSRGWQNRAGPRTQPAASLSVAISPGGKRAAFSTQLWQPFSHPTSQGEVACVYFDDFSTEYNDGQTAGAPGTRLAKSSSGFFHKLLLKTQMDFLANHKYLLIAQIN